jgi:hypothetical protein
MRICDLQLRWLQVCIYNDRHMNDRSEIEWAPRVSMHKIRELYVKEAEGICDEALVDETGYALLWRCQSILEFTAACEGQVLCKRCQKIGVTTTIVRQSHKPAELLRCPVCGWQVRWRVYVSESEKVDGQLHAGNAAAAFRRYVERFPRCKSGAEKILAIDRLIHEFHWVLVEGQDESQGKAWKPAGVNLLRGTSTQVTELLNELTYGQKTIPGLLEGRAWWQQNRPGK